VSSPKRRNIVITYYETAEIRRVDDPLLASDVLHPTSTYKQEIHASLSPVHTSNNVEATFDTVERIVQLLAFDNVAGTLLLVWTGLYTAARLTVLLLLTVFLRTTFAISSPDEFLLVLCHAYRRVFRCRTEWPPCPQGTWQLPGPKCAYNLEYVSKI